MFYFYRSYPVLVRVDTWSGTGAGGDGADIGTGDVVLWPELGLGSEGGVAGFDGHGGDGTVDLAADGGVLYTPRKRSWC